MALEVGPRSFVVEVAKRCWLPLSLPSHCQGVSRHPVFPGAVGNFTRFRACQSALATKGSVDVGRPGLPLGFVTPNRGGGELADELIADRERFERKATVFG
jgi:hypothetical protein